MKKKSARVIDPPLDSIPKLTAMCRHGRLFDVQLWVEEGKPVNFTVPRPKHKREATPLMVAMELGFHSLVEVLLQGGAEVNTTYRYCPMRIALAKKRIDLVQLLVAHGYDLTRLDLTELFGTYSIDIIRWAIAQGLNVTQNMALAHALINRIRPAITLVREFRETLPGVQEQANIALRHFCDEGNQLWVSLLLWAGADAHQKGFSHPSAPSYERQKSAIGFAAESGHLHLLSLKPIRTAMSAEDALDILKYGALPKCMDILTKLFREGLAPNDVPNGSCSRLQPLIEYLRFQPPRSLECYFQRESSYRLDRMKSIHFLAKHGARWKPSETEINSARRSLLEVHADYTAEVIWLSHRYDMADLPTLVSLLRTPAMQKHLTALKSRIDELLQEIEARKHRAAMQTTMDANASIDDTKTSAHV